jgi:hypothetical protein
MTTITMILALLIPTNTNSNTKGSHYYDTMNPRLGNVTHCVYGEMTLKDNGILEGADSTENFHQLMENPEINGIPELTAIDATIKVCQNGGRLVYHVVE